MECSQPGAIREEELLAYLAGEPVRPEVSQHLATCQSCASQLEAYRRAELTLTSMLYRWDCPPGQVLGEYQLGMLSGKAATAIKIHLNTCIRCDAEVATLSNFLANDPLLVERAPAAQITLAPTRVLNHRQSARDARQFLDEVRERAAVSARRIVATLLPPQPRFAYQRELAQAIPSEDLWPRRYTAEDFSISLHIERGAGRRDLLQLIGFITRNGVALNALQGTQAILSTQDRVVQEQQIDELGNVFFAGLIPADYTLELRFSEDVVVIEQLQILPQD